MKTIIKQENCLSFFILLATIIFLISCSSVEQSTIGSSFTSDSQSGITTSNDSNSSGNTNSDNKETGVDTDIDFINISKGNKYIDIGAVSSLRTIYDIYSKKPKLVKSEFETNNEFKNRVEEYINNEPKNEFSFMKPLKLDYDAENEVFNGTIDLFANATGASLILDKYEKKSYYMGQNTFGVIQEITKDDTDSFGIKDNTFKYYNKYSRYKITIPMIKKEAENESNNFYLFIKCIFYPDMDFLGYTSDTHVNYQPTMKLPYEFNIDNHFINGKILYMAIINVNTDKIYLELNRE